MPNDHKKSSRNNQDKAYCYTCVIISFKSFQWGSLSKLDEKVNKGRDPFRWFPVSFNSSIVCTENTKNMFHSSDVFFFQKIQLTTDEISQSFRNFMRNEKQRYYQHSLRISQMGHWEILPSTYKGLFLSCTVIQRTPKIKVQIRC